MTLLLPSLFCFALAAPSAPQDPGATPPPVVDPVQQDPGAGATPPEAFTRAFGEPGRVGSFRARFQPLGAGLVFLTATDHYVSLDAAREPQHGPDDWLLLAWSHVGDHGLRIAGGPGFGSVNPMTAPWTHESLEGGERFTLDLGNGLVLKKTLHHAPQQRGFRVEIALANTGADAVGSLSFQLLVPALVNPAESSLIGNSSIAIAATETGEHVFAVPAAGKVQPLVLPEGGAWSFAGNTNRFFGAFVYPLDAASRAALRTIEADTVPPSNDDQTQTHANTVMRTRLGLELAIPARGAETTLSLGLYVGPKSYRVFETLPEPERFAPVLDVDLNPPCCGVDVPGGRMMAKLLLRLLGWFHDLVGNWGVAIVMLTILVRGLLAPLNFHMQKSMRAFGQRMAVLKPKLDALKQRHGDDQKAYQQAMLQFQREHKMMPPLGGCLPIFLTMPIYIGLFTALRVAYDVRQQPFFAWIEDLSRADGLFALPFWPHHFNLLPLLWIGMFLWMQLRMPLPADPQQRQVQSIMRYMPILFGVMLYNYASALMVYMVASMLWSLFESAIVKRILGPMDPNAAVLAPTPI